MHENWETVLRKYPNPQLGSRLSSTPATVHPSLDHHLLSVHYSIHISATSIMAGFEGFKEIRIPVKSSIVGEIEIYAKVKGSGPGLLLIHGYPQSHQCVLSFSPFVPSSSLRLFSPGSSTRYYLSATRYILPSSHSYHYPQRCRQLWERADGQYVE